MTGPPVAVVDRSSAALARRGLVIATILALAGSALGLIGVRAGTVAGPEIALILSGMLYAAGTLSVLLAWRNVELQIVATVSTTYFTIYLCAGSIIALSGHGHQLNLFVYLVWYFPLLVYNKLVNAPVIARFLAKVIVIAPLAILACFALRLPRLFGPDHLILLAAYCLSNLCAGLVLEIVSRYREKYIVECARVDSLKLESEVLESISDCFIALDADLQLVYVNDAACVEFGIDDRAAFRESFPGSVSGFFSQSMLALVQAASVKDEASTFEAQNAGYHWYEMRCFPQPDGISIFFRNITESLLSRGKLAEAQANLREQADLLDKAQDAIVVADMERRVMYWNKGAERLYGWTAAEVSGQLLADIFPSASNDLNESVAAMLEQGEWAGELSHCRRDGRRLIVESRCTLVRAVDGTPRSILAINTDITMILKRSTIPWATSAATNC
jgi:PAS domain S-box-containing protein